MVLKHTMFYVPTKELKKLCKALFRKKEDALKYVDENNKSSRTHTFALVEDNINN